MTDQTNSLENLAAFEKSVYSQNGEDGVLARLFEMLGCQCKYFVEFGTGPDGSERNTRFLEEVGWQGLLMDQSPNGANPAIHAEHITADNINELFEKYGVPDEFGLLSIDVDGNDYWIWKAISDRYRPWVVVIEYNAGIPATESRAITYDPEFSWEITDYFGASLLALDRLGKRKGYRLVYCESTGVNAFFVRADLCPYLPPPAAKLHRPMAQWPHGGSFPRDPHRQMIDVERPAITGVVLARNESRNIVPCLEALRPHVSQLILIDMESTDTTVSLAEPYIDKLLRHSVVPNFDAVRNIAIPEADFDWLWFVDADEFVPDHVGRQIAALVEGQGDEFEALAYAFATHVGDQWMQHCGWWGGYCTSRVLKRGYFRFSEILHRGVEVNGREIRLPLDFAVPHYSFRDVEHWVEKFNRYTSVEALQLAQRGAKWDWRWAAQGLAHDLWEHYELNDAKLDGNRGWIITWACSQYRWFTIAKLVDHFKDSPLSVPESLDQALQAIVDELHVLRAPRPSLPLGIVLKSPLWDCSGYADEGRAFAKALSAGSAELVLETIDWNDSSCELSAHQRGLLRALTRAKRPNYVAKITNCIPTLVEPDPAASLNILRTTFESDRIPSNWLPQLAKFDEIWVTSNHTKDAFRRSWIPPEKVRVVHSCIDTDQFAPEGPTYENLPSRCEGRFVFLSVFDWQLRKGWDALLGAYAREFSSNSRTALLLKVTKHHHQSMPSILDQANLVLSEVGESLAMRPDIVIWEQSLSGDEMAALYRTVDAFVLPTRGEGWGRPFMEAMASGLPVIGTNGSGNADFMNEENSFIVQSVTASVAEEAAQEMPIYAGHRWVEPNIDDLSRQLRLVFMDPILRNEKSNVALDQVRTKFCLDAGRSRLETALEEATGKFKPPALADVRPSQLSVRLEGEFFAAHSFSNINEELVVELARRDDVALTVQRDVCSPTYDQEFFDGHRVRDYFDRPLPAGPGVVVRHRFPPNWQPPESNARWVHIQPWEMDYLPQDWLPPLRDLVDEIWAPSHFVRDVYLRSGVAADKVHVIPWGINPKVFHPEVTPLLLPTSKSFAFLFVGGTIERKGFDLLLQAYLEEFQSGEDVCLLIKDQGADTIYRGASMKENVREAQLDAHNPDLLYFDGNMTRGQLASLYAACDCLVAPYRGEGFGLPILEAMACATPAIVPRGGASDDFVSEATGFLLPSKAVGVQGAGPLCGPATWLEVSIEDLRCAMRSAFEDPTSLRERGERAAELIHAKFNWKRTVDLMVDRLRIVSDRHTMSSRANVDVMGDSVELAASGTVSLAACVTFHNEEATLGGTLASLTPYVDEIIAVNLHSTDRSVAIAHEYGARVIAADTQRAGWELALQASLADWALLVGAHELIEHDSISSLRGMIAELSPRDEAGSVELHEADGSAHCSSLIRREVRLLRNHSDVVARFCASQHDRCDDGSFSLKTLPLEFRLKRQRCENADEVRLVEWWLLPWIRKKGRVFVDVGANVGTWTHALAPHFSHVYAIEPEPGAVRMLQSQAAENVTVHPVGAWSCDSEVPFTQFEQSVHLSAYFQGEGINTGPSRGTLELPCRSIDGLDLTDVDFIKCDTEGAEIECLRGAERTIRRDRPWLLVESHSSENFSQLTRLLVDWEYMFTVIRDPHYEPFSKLWYEHCWLSCQSLS